MATDKFRKLKELNLKFPEKGVLSFTANGVIPMWAPVIAVLFAGSDIPRVTTTTSQNDPTCIGIAAGGSGDVAGTGNAADAAGDVVDVIPINSAAITKVVVDGAANAITVGQNLITDATAGQAEAHTPIAATANAFIIGKAFQASTVNGDTILIFMGGSQ